MRAGAGRAGRPRFGLSSLLIGLALAVLEIGWLHWFISEPLPNSAPVGRPKLHRSDLLWRALPGVVPGVRLEQSLLGPAMRDLSHVENLPQRAPIVLAAGLIALAALALGDVTLRGLKLLRHLGPSERIARQHLDARAADVHGGIVTGSGGLVAIRDAPRVEIGRAAVNA